MLKRIADIDQEVLRLNRKIKELKDEQNLLRKNCKHIWDDYWWAASSHNADGDVWRNCTKCDTLHLCGGFGERCPCGGA